MGTSTNIISLSAPPYNQLHHTAPCRLVPWKWIDGETFLHLQVVTSDPEALRTAGSTVEVSVKVE